jgi:hypothetical protein
MEMMMNQMNHFVRPSEIVSIVKANDVLLHAEAVMENVEAVLYSSVMAERFPLLKPVLCLPKPWDTLEIVTEALVSSAIYRIQGTVEIRSLKAKIKL